MIVIRAITNITVLDHQGHHGHQSIMNHHGDKAIMVIKEAKDTMTIKTSLPSQS
jgi:hypothetical protein